MTFHTLRHTGATLALAAGVNPKVVQERLGHSSVTLTLDTYSHAVPTLGADAAKRLDALAGGVAAARPAGERTQRDAPSAEFESAFQTVSPT